LGELDSVSQVGTLVTVVLQFCHNAAAQLMMLPQLPS
jgi:hypothetical protein